MKFTKFGKALLMGALTAGVVLGITSCNQSYTVGYLYVTGTMTSGAGNNGIISGYSIDHNTGNLSVIHGLPVASGGSNPVRAVLLVGSRFLYVLNRGVTSSGSADCYGTGTYECQNANITLFAVGGNGILTAEATYYTQGYNPFRMMTDSSGSYLMVLDHDAPSNAYCSGVVSTATCGDITVFGINSTTGVLTLISNRALTQSAGVNVTYFPVPANSVDVLLSSSYLFTLYSTTAQTSYPYTGGSAIFPYTYSSGQLTVASAGAQTLTDGSTGGVPSATTINSGGGYIYVLDNNSITVDGVTHPSQILPYSVASSGNGALSSQTGGVVPDNATQANPIALLWESKDKWAYVANQANDSTSEAESGLAGWVIDTSTKQLTPEISGGPWGNGTGPVCLVEDPSDQFLYTANAYSSTVTGKVLDQNAGTLSPINGSDNYVLDGPPTWCLVDARTN